MRAGFPQRAEAHRGPSCSCCKITKIRILVRVGTPEDPDYGVRACPACDRVELGEPGGHGLVAAGPLRSAPKVPRTTP